MDDSFSISTPVIREFEHRYLALRKQENRLYSDEELRALPEINNEHPHKNEWQIRKAAAQRLCRYLNKTKKTLRLAEIGCGNGWLSAYIARHTAHEVTGTDINRQEINQAIRVFGNNGRLRFQDGDIFTITAPGFFDCIIFAASIQYFPSLHHTITRCAVLLDTGGEIHILDSHFYSSEELEPAQKRSALYFEAAGFPDMNSFYFHHQLPELENYPHTILFDPGSLKNRFTRPKNPFYWIRIRPHD